MPPKRFEGKFRIPASDSVESELTSALYRLPDSVNLVAVEKMVDDITIKVNKRLEEQYEEMIKGESKDTSTRSARSLSQDQIKTLHLKLARHYEDNGESAHIDIPTCVDALVESPKFLDSVKGSMDKLFEIHEMKTLQKIAELRRKRAELDGNETYNPYENLFETEDGQYYLARLLNMPHLEDESAYMDHCVGTSTSYVNKIKKGEVEIFSFRDQKSHIPLVTIEYDAKGGQLLQIKGISDRIPQLSDEISGDLLEALEKLQGTINDQGQPRKVTSHVVTHMKELKSLERKMEVTREALTRDELLFLYEVNRPIECFDASRDGVIGTLLSKRDRKQDIKTMCNCPQEFIVTDFTDIALTTQVYCEDTGSKIIFFDFREEKNKKKLPQLIELGQTIKKSGTPARPDLSIEGGIVHLDIDKQRQEALSTYTNAKVAYEYADNKSPSWMNPLFDTLGKEYIPPLRSSLDIVVLNHGQTSPQQRDKLVADMDKVGYRPLEFSELLVLGICKPELNKRSEILNTYRKYSLGGSVQTSYLYWSGGERGVGAVGVGSVWGGHIRFLFVRK